MGAKKVIGGNIAIVLGIVCVIFVSGLVGAIANYTSIINDKDAAYQGYLSTHSHTNSEFNSLDASYDSYMGTHSHTDSEYDQYVADHHVTDGEYNDLQSGYNNYVDDHHHSDGEFDSVTAPKLITVDLTARDLGAGLPLFGTPILHVYGYICNVGTYAAYNSKIHVLAYQSGGVVAIDTYITLGTIYGESWTRVDSNFDYSGEALISWTLTPLWTATP